MASDRWASDQRFEFALGKQCLAATAGPFGLALPSVVYHVSRHLTLTAALHLITAMPRRDPLCRYMARCTSHLYLARQYLAYRKSRVMYVFPAWRLLITYPPIGARYVRRTLL